MITAIHGYFDIAEYLIGRKAIIDAKDQYVCDFIMRNGWTAVFVAAIYGRWDIAQLLIKQKADVNVTDK